MAKVLMLGRLRDVAGWRERAVDPVPQTLSALRAQLSREDEALGEALAGKGIQPRHATLRTLRRPGDGQVLDQALTPNIWKASLRHFLRPNPTAWEWACRSAARSWKVTEDGYG